MISVYFRKGGHPAYSEILEFPPEGVKYVEAGKLQGREGITPPMTHKLKRIAFRAYRGLTGDINAIRIRCREDLIFSSGGLLVKSDTPWVTDAEHAYSIIGHRQRSQKVAEIRKKTAELIASSKCRILPWSMAARKSIENFFGPDYQKMGDKIEVVYPAMHIEESEERLAGRKKGGDVTFLYISRTFLGKAGYEVLKAFDGISRKYDARMIFLSRTPANVKNEFGKNKGITFIDAPLDRKKVLKLYGDSHVFVLPTLFDTFGFVYLEAMAFSLPVIATDHFAVSEIVKDGVSGLLVRPEYSLFGSDQLYAYSSIQEMCRYAEHNVQRKLISQLEEKMAFFIDNPSEIKRYGSAGRKSVEKGTFSIKERNRKLRDVFGSLAGGR